MQTLHLDSLAGHIVAWHNRHPLARRIGVQHVQSLGYVVLPFATTATTASPTAESGVALELPPTLPAQAQPQTGDGGTLRERAMARALQAPEQTPGPAPTQPSTPEPTAARSTAPPAQLRGAFSEDFIRPLRPAEVAAFALQHGADQAAPGKDSPVRMVKPDAGLAMPTLQRRWLLTAQVEVDGRRTRLLAGAGRSPALLGRRLWSLPRVGLAIAGPLVMAAVLAMAVKALLGRSAVPVATPATPVLAVPSGAASQASPSLQAPQVTEVLTAASAAASAAEAAAASAAAMPASAVASGVISPPASAPSALQVAPVPPTDVNPTWGRVNLPSIGPAADERRRAALAARQAAPTAVAVSASAAQAASSVPAAAALAPQRARPMPPPAVDTGPAFALSSGLIRTRAESEQIADAMRGLLVTGSDLHLQVEALRSGDDWRVVCWPFPSRAQADKARTLLASRGLKVQVVDF